MPDVERIEIYKTSDGREFHDEYDANEHERTLEGPAFVRYYEANPRIHLYGESVNNYQITGEQILKWLQDNYGEFMEVLGLLEDF